MGYELVGRMAEVCSCKTICPCTTGLEPDNGVCDFSWTFHFDKGAINDVDVAGLNLTLIGRLDGSPVDGTVRAGVFVDDASSEAQHGALIDAFTGQAGGPLADLASLVGEVVTVERVPIDFDVTDGTGSFRAGDIVSGAMEVHRSPSGTPTKLVDTALSGVLGSPAYISEPTSFDLNAEQHGFAIKPGSATQFEFHYVAD